MDLVLGQVHDGPPAPPPPPPQPATTTRACTNCAKVKCKCIPYQDGTGCERCHRLHKECKPSEVVKRRRAKRHGGSRVARVESRLEELVSILLESQRDGPSKEPEAGPDLPARQLDGGPVTDVPAATVATSTPVLEHASAGSARGTEPTSTSTDSYAEEPSSSRADEILNKFREETVAFFPCVYIPPEATSESLRATHPFLWLNIITATSASPRERDVLSSRVRAVILQKIVVDREKSLDLLLGLVVFLAWSHLQGKNKRYTTLFAQLVMGLIYDMGLHRAPPVRTHFCPSFKEGDAPLLARIRARRTDEERRAVLGAYLLTSTLAYAFRRGDALRWSPHLEGYLASLRQHSAVPQDQCLIALIRMQLIVGQVHDAGWTARDGCGPEQPPPALYLSALRARLLDVVQDERLGPNIGNNPMVQMLQHFTDLLVHYAGVLPQQPPAHTAAAADPSSCGFETETETESFRRLAAWQGCFDAIRAWLGAFFAVPLARYADLPATVFPQLVRVLACLFHVSTCPDPAWDRAAVRRAVDLVPTCERIIANFDAAARSVCVTVDVDAEAGEAASPPSEGDNGDGHVVDPAGGCFSWCVEVLRHKQARWQRELSASDLATATATAAGTGLDAAAAAAAQQQQQQTAEWWSNGSDGLFGSPADLYGDGWFSDLLNTP
ncbi:hypothetical protein GGR56DRAFT_92408 [Xylariaceae sp. FL0804]|nr:hypothetical protein GGR56DRAFT_92408 [Xylariaceae sp. FL0804]